MKYFSFLLLMLLSTISFAQNLVSNGDFEAGNTGFTTTYVNVPPAANPTPGPSHYAITDTAEWYKPIGGQPHPWQPCTDHTHLSGPGKNMMVMDAASVANQPLWCQTVYNIKPNTAYKFSTWVESVILIKEYGTPSLPILQFKINGELLGQPFKVTDDACNWSQFYEIWNSGNSTSADICIVNQNLEQKGNDLAIDDISLMEVGLSMPNVFTPNGDGKNDTYVPITFEEVDSYSFIIIDRWGRLVYEQKQAASVIQPTWNGKMMGDGADCAAGTYYWVLNYGVVTNTTENKTLTGYLTLIR